MHPSLAYGDVTAWALRERQLRGTQAYLLTIEFRKIKSFFIIGPLKLSYLTFQHKQILAPHIIPDHL